MPESSSQLDMLENTFLFLLFLLLLLHKSTVSKEVTSTHKFWLENLSYFEH